MPNLEKRLETLEQAATDTRRTVILLFGNQSESDALMHRGLPPETDAFFIRVVPLQPNPIGAEHAHIE
jgi:hypothetical protein